MSSVRLSVTLVDRDHIGWKSWKLIARTISPTTSLFVIRRSSTYSQGNMEKFWGENVRGCLFTFVGASRGHLCDSTAFLYYILAVNSYSYKYVSQVSISTQPTSALNSPTTGRRNYDKVKNTAAMTVTWSCNSSYGVWLCAKTPTNRHCRLLLVFWRYVAL